MKIKLTHKNKLYSVAYRQLNENEPLQANGIRMHILGNIAKYEPDLLAMKSAMNKNDLNIQIYEIEVS